MKKISLSVMILSCLFALSCNKSTENNTSDSAKAQLGIEVRGDVQGIQEVAQNESATLTLAVVADPVSDEGYTITVAANPSLVSAYNSKNGTSYQMLPSEAFSLGTTTVMLPRYSAKSTTFELRLKGAGCEPDQIYVLPIAIESVQGGTHYEAPDDKAAYVLFKMLEPRQQGSGKANDPFIIKDLEAFLKIGSMMQDNATTYFKLGTDIDFAEVTFTDENPWTPFNYATTDEEMAAAEKRKVVLDGDNHKISNFVANAPLFGVLTGSVQNLVIENAKVTAERNDGAILAMFGGTAASMGETLVKNVTIKSSEVSNDYKRAGGLLSWLKGGILEDVDVECDVRAEQQVGGLVGRVDAGTILNCSASGDVVSGVYFGGGLAGYIMTATFKNCHASGNVTSETGNYSRVGGLLGHVVGDTLVEKCYATGNVSGAGHFAGGLVSAVQGELDGDVVKRTATLIIKDSYATGNVTLPTTNNFAHAGGLLGSVLDAGCAIISNCYATGAIVARRYGSGFVGSVGNVTGKLSVTNSYSTSDISGINLAERSGVFLGNDSGSTEISVKGFVAWDTSNTSRFAYPPETAEKLLAGNYLGTEGTVAQQAAKFGWDTSIWDLNKDLPTLK